eukprot:7486276-Heterocapsa_arctica.AAC.1
MSLTSDVPGPPCSGDGLFRIVRARLGHLLMFNVVPGFELLWGELIGLWYREGVHFLDHRVADVGRSDRP